MLLLSYCLLENEDLKMFEILILIKFNVPRRDSKGYKWIYCVSESSFNFLFVSFYFINGNNYF